MNFRSLIFTPLLLCFACGNNDRIEPKNEPPVSDTISSKKLNVPKLGAINYSFTPDIKTTPYRGDFITSANWKDARGQNIFIISIGSQEDWQKKFPEMKKLAKEYDDNDLASIFVYHYIYNDSLAKWKTYWTIHDYKFNCCDVYIRYQPGSLLVEDINADGKAETSFFYIFPHFTDKYYHSKLILHVDSSKIKVEGTTGRDKNRYSPDEPPEKYSGEILKQNPLYTSWAKTTWLICDKRQSFLDSLENIKYMKEYEKAQTENK